MAKANVILLNSILWNLREVTKLAEKIKKHCGDVDCTSWRYPLASCSQLEIFKLLQNNRNLDNYTYILELTYDRLLYVFNLIIKYLESMESLEKFRPSKNVHRPKTLSLASVLYMIWDRIRAQAEAVNQTVAKEKAAVDESKKEEITASKSTICTQSEVCSISVCSCCEMAQNFVTQLVLEMERILEKQEIESAISHERKVMREYLVEMTNWSAMSRWLTAILKDFTAISEKAEQGATNSRKLKHRLDSGERKMKSRIDQLEEENRKLETNLRDQERKSHELQQEMESLLREKIRMNEEIKSKDSTLSATISNFETKISELRENYESEITKKMDRKLKKEIERKDSLNRKLESERKKSKQIESENESLKETIDKLRADLDDLKSKSGEERSNSENLRKNLEAEVDRLNKEKESLNAVLGEKQKVIEDYSMRLMEAFPELNGAPKNKYKASGNPEIDMETQIEANKLRIDLLLSENEKLRKTLDKIKTIKG